MSDDRELIAHLDAKESAERFAASDLGRTMLGMAQQDLEIALDELAQADVKDEAKMLDIQNRVRLGRMIPGWLNELVLRAEEEIAARRQHTD